MLAQSTSPDEFSFDQILPRVLVAVSKAIKNMKISYERDLENVSKNHPTNSAISSQGSSISQEELDKRKTQIEKLEKIVNDFSKKNKHLKEHQKGLWVGVNEKMKSVPQYSTELSFRLSLVFLFSPSYQTPTFRSP